MKSAEIDTNAGSLPRKSIKGRSGKEPSLMFPVFLAELRPLFARLRGVKDESVQFESTFLPHPVRFVANTIHRAKYTRAHLVLKGSSRCPQATFADRFRRFDVAQQRGVFSITNPHQMFPLANVPLEAQALGNFEGRDHGAS